MLRLVGEVTQLIKASGELCAKAIKLLIGNAKRVCKGTTNRDATSVLSVLERKHKGAHGGRIVEVKRKPCAKLCGSI